MILQNPDLLFLVFLEKQGKPTPKNKDFLSSKPLKSLGKKGKTSQKNKESPCNEKNKEIPQKQGKEDQATYHLVLFKAQLT